MAWNRFPSSDEVKSALIKEADDILKNRFRFNNPWDMEQCREPFDVSPRSFDAPPNSDPEWVYQLSRMEYLNKLLVAYDATDDKRYLLGWTDFILKKWYPAYGRWKKPGRISVFAARVKRKLKIKGRAETNRTLDVAIRDWQILVGMEYLKLRGDLPENTESQILAFVKKDDGYLEKNYANQFNYTSNWGLIILLCRLACLIMTDSPDKIR